MYLSTDIIIKAAAVISALGVIIGAIAAVVRTFIRDKKQTKIIEEIQDEQLIICKGLRGALQGLIEQGCNGPCREALTLLDNHLNERAHNPDLR